jgi:hypothetical protein
MKTAVAALVALAALAMVCVSQQPEFNTLTPEEKAAGWQLLFDGKTFAGWHDPAREDPPSDSWTIEDGCLKATANPRILEDLVTLAKFRNFEMVFDWRISPGGNSGVKYLIQKQVLLDYDKIPPDVKGFEAIVGYLMEHNLSGRARPGRHNEYYLISFEYQVIDDARNPDARRGAQYSAGALYSVVPPIRDATRPVGEFNHSRLVLREDHVEHWLNGVKVVDTSLDSPEIAKGFAKRWHSAPLVYELLTKRPRRDSPIALQNHDSAAWFRNLKIRVF